jgi:hypothetical protein
MLAEESMMCRSARRGRIAQGVHNFAFLSVGKTGAAVSDKGLFAGSLKPLDRGPASLSTKGLAEVSHREGRER